MTKTLTGAVMGMVTAAIVQMGLTPYQAGHRPESLLVLVAAFAGGFKEQWFLDALGSLRPLMKNAATAKPPSKTTRP